MSDSITRRGFAKATLSSVLTAALLQTVFESDALAAKIKPVTERWLRDLDELCRGLEGKALSQLQWQSKVEELFGKVELEEMFRLIDLDRMMASEPDRTRGRGEGSFGVPFPQIEGLPMRLAFGRQVFAVRKGSSVVPHGHNNMATAFYVLRGDFHGRHYDRLRDEEQHMIVRPTLDEKCGPTSCTTISDFKDNVHWFKSLADVSYIFNIHVIDQQADNGKPTGRIYIDPDGEKLSDGTIRAPLISGTQAYAKYG